MKQTYEAGMHIFELLWEQTQRQHKLVKQNHYIIMMNDLIALAHGKRGWATQLNGYKKLHQKVQPCFRNYVNLFTLYICNW